MDTAIYLDFDGVLFPIGRPVFDAEGGYVGSRRPLETFESFGRALRDAGLDPGLIVTSSWRETHTIQQLSSLLGGLGVTLPVRGVTPVLAGESDHSRRRFGEIATHVSCEPSKRVFVFDDLPLRDLGRETDWTFVQTRPGVGLRTEDLPLPD